MKILIAVDGSPYSDAAIEEVVQRPWPSHSELKVITAAETPVTVGMDPWAAWPEHFEELEKSVREAAKAVVERAVLRLKSIQDPTVTISGDVIQGSPKQVIPEEADRWDADLIVVGSRGLGAWNRLLLGSVSNSVLQHARCSVEVVRKPQIKE